MRQSRRAVLAGTLLLTAALVAVTLMEIWGTVVFGITVAYVLLPIRIRLRERGFSRRVAAGVSTAVAFVGVVSLVLPIAFVLYRRRADLFEFLRILPETVPVTVGGVSLIVQTADIIDATRTAASDLALSLLRVAPVLALKFVVFSLLVYGLLYRPGDVERAVLKLVPSEYHDVASALHRRTAQTLRAIYVLQAVTAVGTFVLAAIVFIGFGYESPFALAVIAGILQFIPVLGPSLLVIGLAGIDLVIGNVTRALLVLVIGLIVIGFLPDSVIRTRLAHYAADLPTSLYFIGFVGGVLTVGAIGFIVGPLVVGLLVEVVQVLSDTTQGDQQRLLGG